MDRVNATRSRKSGGGLVPYLAVACAVRYQICNLEAAVPELRGECEQFRARLDTAEKLLVAILDEEDVSGYEKRIFGTLFDLSSEFQHIAKKANSLIAQARSKENAAAGGVVVGLACAVAGCAVTALSCGFDCGAGVCLGMGGGIGGVVGAVISADNIDKCQEILLSVEQLLSQFENTGRDFETKYGELASLLEADLNQNVWLVKDWGPNIEKMTVINISSDDVVLRKVGVLHRSSLTASMLHPPLFLDTRPIY